MKKLRAADLFCGAGGTTVGAVMSGAVDVRFALNHWAVAIETHSRNHPTTKHVNSRLDQTSPGECDSIDLLFASPECTHHSRARGGRPTSDQQRSGAWDVMKWIEHHRPSYVVVENVVEFAQWGPVGRDGRPLPSGKGKSFDAWLMAIRSQGYRVEYRELNAADHGAATSRNRLFVIARKGNRLPPWPEPTHSRDTAGALPGMGLQGWRAAAEVIDWTVPMRSIFARSKPLADNTLLRLEAGLRRFVGPYVTQWDQASNRNPSRPVSMPLATMVTKANMGLAVPYVAKFNNNQHSESLHEPLTTILSGGGHHGLVVPFISKQFGTHDGAYNPNVSTAEPLGTVTTVDHNGLGMAYLVDTNHPGPAERVYSPDLALGTIPTHNGKALAMRYIVPHFGERAGQVPRTHGIEAALPTVTSQGAGSLAVPWLSSFYGNETSVSASSPVATITTKDRHSLCVAICRGPQDWPEPTSDAMRTLQATMRELGVADLHFRMLQNHELSAAQGFPAEYLFAGTKAEVTRQIGNSVSPPVAKVISQAIAG